MVKVVTDVFDNKPDIGICCIKVIAFTSRPIAGKIPKIIVRKAERYDIERKSFIPINNVKARFDSHDRFLS